MAERITKYDVHCITGDVEVKYLMGRIGPTRRWPLFTAESKVEDQGTITTLHCPLPLIDRLGIKSPLSLSQEEIGQYGKDFENYVDNLLKEAKMYVARALWINDDSEARYGVKHRILRGTLWEERKN